MKQIFMLLTIMLSLLTTEVKALSCGDTVYSSVALSEDLINCSGTALFVNSSDVVIKLNGHTIDGIGSSNGIVIRSGKSKVKILGPGIIREFETGIVINNGLEHQLNNIHIENNTTAIYALNASECLFYNNDMTNGINGLILDGSSSNNNVIKQNFIMDMLSEAIWLIDANQNQINSNYLLSNNTALRLSGASKNKFSYNHVISNEAGIIFNISTSGIGSGYNQLLWNKIYDNDHAIFFSTYASTNKNVKNSLTRNAIRGGITGLEIGDSGNLKTLVKENSFFGQSNYNIYDQGSSTIFNGNRCEGIPCP